MAVLARSSRVIAAVAAMTFGLGTAVVVANAPPASAAWLVSIQPASRAQASSRPAPAAPATVTAVCVNVLLSNQVTVSWTSVPNATSYTIYYATAGPTGPFTAVVPDVTSSPWVATLSTAGYWFAVTAHVGANWTSVRSAPSGSVTVLLGLLCG